MVAEALGGGDSVQELLVQRQVRHRRQQPAIPCPSHNNCVLHSAQIEGETKFPLDDVKATHPLHHEVGIWADFLRSQPSIRGTRGPRCKRKTWGRFHWKGRGGLLEKKMFSSLGANSGSSNSVPCQTMAVPQEFAAG